MEKLFNGYNARTITPYQLHSLQKSYGYNEDEDLNKFISYIYLLRNPNFKYNSTVITSYVKFKKYYDETFTYDFDEWYCIGWFIDKQNVFHSVCLDDGTFTVYQRKLKPTDTDTLHEIRKEFGVWEIKI